MRQKELDDRLKAIENHVAHFDKRMCLFLIDRHLLQMFDELKRDRCGGKKDRSIPQEN